MSPLQCCNVDLGHLKQRLQISLHPMSIRTVGTKSNRDGIGARVILTAGGRRQPEEVRSGGSYLSQNDLRLHFGLGRAKQADTVEVRWPSGRIDRLSAIPANQIILVREGQGIVSAVKVAR